MFAHASIFNGPRSFSMFGAPEPEPEISSLEWFCVALVFSAIIVAACVGTWWYLKTTWPKRFEGAVRHSFNKVDVDKSGEIDKEELYTCVLWLYLTCNEWGLKCIAPEKYTVIEIMKSIDVDKSGTLNWEEFKQIFMVFSEQIGMRALAQLVFTLMCPFVAGIICSTIAMIFRGVPSLLLPRSVIKVFSMVPEAVPVLALSTILFTQLTYPLDWVDQFTGNNRATRYRKSLQKECLPRPGPSLDNLSRRTPSHLAPRKDEDTKAPEAAKSDEAADATSETEKLRSNIDTEGPSKPEKVTGERDLTA